MIEHMTARPEDPVDRALVIVAHPDDIEFWLAGTIAMWVAAGTRVTYCVLTDGDAGGYDETVPRSEIPQLRRTEQLAAAKVLGISDVRFLGLGEDEVRCSPHLRRELVQLIREIRPHRVVTWSPEWNWARFRSSHPNHRATGTVTLEAIYPDADNKFAHMDLLADKSLAPWRVPEIWLINSPRPDHYVDITEVFDKKVAAVSAHRSQVGNRPNLASELRARIEPNASLAGLPHGRLAEAFQVVLNQ
jgi:LmbE family N-acetylglucosaminyl deacetylase